ncbi:SDR family NAD(P)-dependent oxidoreductase [Pseudoalteromonas sp. L23]|uniref:type I polyketide synthase n=1 Tax=unclassified Pseudoalteromonas TaxID=194690 RepID=UPI001EF06E64|nr:MULTISPECIES: type I polyketide synthase [unclassified Pseudoalteromonas]MCF7515587.1 SDR family NAD(P)-dependent oxidoreductase [Pseudoalteromonas sp. L7]MCF7527533.1 SDR family NAD(P)-dependent oxidoreductase [Pseudoalteromonas sp. L23]
MTTETYSSTDIAIVGLAGRFPGAENVDALWENLKNGVESIKTFTEAELRELGVSEATIADPNFVPRCALLPDQDKFDASFFGYSPREAEELDPQQRLFLETAWQALENAGYDGDKCDFPIGVYGGCGVNTYLISNLMQSGRFSDLGNISQLQALMNGNNKDAMTMTLAYKLNLKGPAVTVQTACSTSLAAVHMATRSLLNYESDMTLAGGSWLNFLHQGGYVYQPGAILSPDGHCRPFDADSQGTVIGSGSGVVVLKRLEDAMADGDTIYAVIKGSAMNNDGNTKAGYTAPSVDGQAEVIAAALEMADTPAESIGYVEAHGTGTVIGDPIEIAALTRAYRMDTEQTQYCAVGSVKSNVGHLDAAAGVTGLIKAALTVKHGQIPPSLHYKQANPEIDFANSPFYVADKLTPWSNETGPRRAGVSSFGIGGTNVHVVLEEPPVQRATQSQRNWQILPLSGHTKTALASRREQLATWFKQASTQPLWQDSAYTLQVGRKGLTHRAVVVAQNSEQAIAALADDTSTLRAQGQLTVSGDRPVTFMFPGQGSQHINMARALYESESVFRDAFDRCREGLIAHVGQDIKDFIFVDEADVEHGAAQLKQTSVTQPVLFAVEYALAQQWLAWGVKPSAMIGHSIGEYVAACIAGVFSLEDALYLVAKRGEFIQAQAPGCMLSVALSEAALAPYLDTDNLGHKVELAAVNSPENCVVSGSEQAIAALSNRLTEQGVVVQPLHVSHAFHSSLVSDAGDQLAKLIAQVQRNAPSIPFVSNVTGTWITDQQATDPQYWAQHLAQAVRFNQGLRTIVNLDNPESENGLEQTVLLEVGPSNTLSQLAGRDAEVKAQTSIVTSLPHPRKAQETEQHFALALGRLWIEGVEIDWDALYEQTPHRVALPVYPFERKRFWIEADANIVAQNNHNALAPKPIEQWCYISSYKRSVPDLTQPVELGCTLLFETQHKACDLLLDKLHTQSDKLIRVKLGQAFQQESDNEFVIRAAQLSDYQQLIASVNQIHGPVSHIFHLWSLPASEPADLSQTQQQGMMSLIALAQALESQQLGQPVNLSVVSQGLADVSGNDEISPAQSMLLGPCKVIPQEFPHIQCQLVDFGAQLHGDWIDWLLSEQHGEAGEVVAYRSYHRWLMGFEATAKPKQNEAIYRQGGVYLITGGLGGVGLVMAEHLAEHYQAKLVLLGRSTPSEAQQQKLAQLQSFGAQVLVKQADVADFEQMAEVVAQAHQQFGQINGVIHAAGSGATSLISSTDAAFIEQMFAAKVVGTQHLLALFNEQPLDFMVLCSSLASIAGGLSKAAYASANAYLDGIAQQYAQQSVQTGGYPILAVNWDSWREVGMAGDMDMPDGVGIAPQQGVEVMARILSAPILPQVAVSTLDLPARLEATKGNLLDAELTMADATPRSGGYERPELSTPYVAPEDDLQVGIAQVWSAMLGIEQIGIHDNLFELGGDSLMGVQIMSQLSNKFEVTLSPASFFKEPTILGLAQVIEAILIQELQQELAEELAEGAK